MSNTIRWGKIHGLSYSPETNLTGTAAAPSFSNTKSVRFDGVDDYVTLGTPINLRITGSVSVSCWVKYTDSGGTRYINSFGDKYGLYINSGKLFWHYRNTANQFKSVGSATTFNDGQWHHVMGVNDGTNLKIYIDGVLNNSNTNGSSGIVGTSDSRIGARFNNANHYEGNIDEFAIWDSDQSANISSIYSSSGAVDLSSLSPLGWWRMGDGDTFPTLTDNGSGGNNGTMTNMTSGNIITDVPT